MNHPVPENPGPNDPTQPRDPGDQGENGYVCFYGGQRFECCAPTLYAAQQKAVAHFKPPKSKRHFVSAHFAEKATSP